MQNTDFSQEQYDNIYPEGIEKHYWNHARNKIILHQLKKHNLTENKILEIGCGKGIVVKYLRNKNIDCYGAELADISIDNELKEFVITKIDANTLNFEERESYNTIMLLDVIEHIEKPEEFLSTLKSNFPNAKTFIISVPACSELWSNYDEYNGHFRRYDKNLLTGTLNKSGFTSLKTKYLFHLLYLPALMLVKAKKQRSVELKAPKGISKIIHKILSLYFFIESIVYFHAFKGTSLITIAKYE